MNGDAYDLKCDVFGFAILMCCLGVDDGAPRSLYSQSLKLEKGVQLSNLTGIHFASMHARGQRILLDGFDWPQCMKDLVRSCWNHDPELRPTFDEIGEKVNKWDAVDFGEAEVDENVSVD